MRQGPNGGYLHVMLVSPPQYSARHSGLARSLALVKVFEVYSLETVRLLMRL